MIKPTIGRKVWFWPDSSVYANYISDPTPVENQPFDATVVAVYGDRMVNLRVTDHNGTSWFESSVPLMQDDDTISGSRFATWMPYQVSQAKKKST
jgi:hypothetical protein